MTDIKAAVAAVRTLYMSSLPAFGAAPLTSISGGRLAVDGQAKGIAGFAVERQRPGRRIG